MARRRRRRRNPSTAGEVIGGVLGFLFPPLGLGALVTGVSHPSFWRGAAVGGVIGAGVGLVIYVGGRGTAALPRRTLGDDVHVPDLFAARGEVFRAIGEDLVSLTGSPLTGGPSVTIARSEVTQRQAAPLQAAGA